MLDARTPARHWGCLGPKRVRGYICKYTWVEKRRLVCIGLLSDRATCSPSRHRGPERATRWRSRRRRGEYLCTDSVRAHVHARSGGSSSRPNSRLSLNVHQAQDPALCALRCTHSRLPHNAVSPRSVSLLASPTVPASPSRSVQERSCCRPRPKEYE